jgi:hypothetical protein
MVEESSPTGTDACLSLPDLPTGPLTDLTRKSAALLLRHPHDLSATLTMVHAGVCPPQAPSHGIQGLRGNMIQIDALCPPPLSGHPQPDSGSCVVDCTAVSFFFCG